MQAENMVIPEMENFQILNTISEPGTMQDQDVTTTENNIYIQENNITFALEAENI